jgi:hypothetical protein
MKKRSIRGFGSLMGNLSSVAKKPMRAKSGSQSINPKEKMLLNRLMFNAAAAVPLIGGAAMLGASASQRNKRQGMSQIEQSKKRQLMSGLKNVDLKYGTRNKYGR